MSVWHDIDRMKAKHEREFEEAKNELESMGAIKGSLGVDDYGLWRIRYVPKGERKQESLSARTHVVLIERLRAIRQRETGSVAVPSMAPRQ